MLAIQAYKHARLTVNTLDKLMNTDYRSNLYQIDTRLQLAYTGMCYLTNQLLVFIWTADKLIGIHALLHIATALFPSIYTL